MESLEKSLNFLNVTAQTFPYQTSPHPDAPIPTAHDVEKGETIFSAKSGQTRIFRVSSVYAVKRTIDEGLLQVSSQNFSR